MTTIQRQPIMSEIHKNVGLTQGDAFADLMSSESLQDVLENHPDYVKNISQYHECQNPTSKGSSEVDSDSGDSLFLTQKPAPQPVRAIRERKSSRHTYATEHEDSGGDSSSSHRDEHDRGMSRKKKKPKIKLPKYSFHFLPKGERSPRGTHLATRDNIKLHNYVMGGFFKCVELWQGADDLWMALPTVDQDEDISPLTEDGEDQSSDEDIKVVDKKCFVVKSKLKQQPWCTPSQCTKQGKHQQEEGVVPQEREKIVELSSELPTSSMPLPKDKNNPVCSSSPWNIPAVFGNNEPLRTNMVQIQTPTSKRIPFPKERQELIEPEVNLQLDLSVKENPVFSLSHNKFTEKTKRGEVEELRCAVNESLNDNEQRKKVKKKGSHHKCGSLDMTADPRETGKKKFADASQEDDISEKSYSDATALSLSIGMTKKKSSVMDIFYTPDKTQQVAGETQKMTDDKEVQLIRKKKSKRMVPEDDEFVSEKEKKNNGTSSFLVADVEESSTLEADSHYIFKKKKKKKKSARNESTEDFEGASSRCALPEIIETGLKSKKRRTDSQVKRQESAAASGQFKPDEDKLKNKNKDWLQSDNEDFTC